MFLCHSEIIPNQHQSEWPARTNSRENKPSHFIDELGRLFQGLLVLENLWQSICAKTVVCVNDLRVRRRCTFGRHDAASRSLLEGLLDEKFQEKRMSFGLDLLSVLVNLEQTSTFRSCILPRWHEKDAGRRRLRVTCIYNLSHLHSTAVRPRLHSGD